MEIDERDEKKRELRTRNVRVRLLARYGRDTYRYGILCSARA